MSSAWRDDDEDYKVAGVRGGLRSKPRFSFAEVKLLLEAVKRNRYIILRKFNQGVSAEAKKQTWAEITEQVNSLGENRREVRQIMKKWADLKCDGKRRIAALRGPNGTSLRKKRLGPVEKMVHKILSMSPRGDGDSDVDFGEDEDFAGKGSAAAYSYLSIASGGINLDFSPLSSPEKELGGDPLQSSSEFDVADEGEPIMDFDENDDSVISSNYSSLPLASSTLVDPPPDDARLRVKPVHTYSRNNGQNPNHTSPTSPPGPSSPVASTSDAAAAPPSQSPTATSARPSSSVASFAAPPPTASPSPTATARDSTSPPAPSSTKPLQPPSSSSSILPPKLPSASGSAPSDPFPAFARRPHEHVAQLAAQSVQQQQASRALLTSVSQSLEILAQSVQLLVESQQEFVQESLLLQRETVDILRDFSNTALSMLREKSGGGQTARHQNLPF